MRQGEGFMFAGALVVLAFGFGLYLGGLVHSRRVADELARGKECLERMNEVNHAAVNLAAAVTEVNRERVLFLGGGQMFAGYEPGVPELSEKYQGKGGR